MRSADGFSRLADFGVGGTDDLGAAATEGLGVGGTSFVTCRADLGVAVRLAKVGVGGIDVGHKVLRDVLEADGGWLLLAIVSVRGVPGLPDLRAPLDLSVWYMNMAAATPF